MSHTVAVAAAVFLSAVLTYCSVLSIIGERPKRRKRRKKTGVNTRLALDLRALGFKSYAAYLASDHWQAVKRRKMRGQGIIACAGCGATTHLDLHHATYERLGRERQDDVVLLCDRCHADAHMIARRGVKLHRAHLALRQRRRCLGYLVGPLS